MTSSGQNFFQTPVGECRGVPPLRLQRSQSARPRRYPGAASGHSSTRLPSAVSGAAAQPASHDSTVVVEEMELVRDRPRTSSGTSETHYHSKSSSRSSVAGRSSDASRSSLSSSMLEKRQEARQLLPFPHQKTACKRPKSAVVKDLRQKKVRTKALLGVEGMTIPEEEEQHAEFPPLLLDCFKTKAVLYKRVNYVLTASERIGSNMTPNLYLARMPPRFPLGRHNYSVLPHILNQTAKAPRNPESRLVLVTKLLRRRHRLWAASQAATARQRAARASALDRPASNVSVRPRLSPAGLKVVEQFHLQGVLKKQQERTKLEAAKFRKTKQGKKVGRQTPAKVRYREASQLCSLEDQLRQQQAARARRPQPSQHDLLRFNRYLREGIAEHQVTTPPPNLLKVVTLDVDKMVLRNIRFRLVVSELVEELRACYLRGVRLAVLRYALQCPALRHRLGIGVAVEGYEPVVVRAPLPWHQSFVTGRHHCYHNLFALTPILTALHAIWDQRFEGLRFVDMRALVGGDGPTLSPEKLEARVRAQCAATRTLLLHKALTPAGDDATTAGGGGASIRLFPSDVATLRRSRHPPDEVTSRASILRPGPTSLFLTMPRPAAPAPSVTWSPS